MPSMMRHCHEDRCASCRNAIEHMAEALMSEGYSSEEIKMIQENGCVQLRLSLEEDGHVRIQKSI